MVSSPRRVGNTKARPVRIPNTLECHVLVREFIRGRRILRQRVTTSQVLDFFVEKEILEVQEDEPGIMNRTALRTALRCVQRYVNRRGFARGRKTGTISVRPHHIAWRNRHIFLLD